MSRYNIDDTYTCTHTHTHTHTHALSQVIHRLGAEAPKKSLVENYMVEIARNYHINYQPDPTMFMVTFIIPTIPALLYPPPP